MKTSREVHVFLLFQARQLLEELLRQKLNLLGYLKLGKSHPPYGRLTYGMLIRQADYAFFPTPKKH